MIGTRVAFRGAFGPHEGVVLKGAAPEVTCAPSAQGMQALPMVLVVPSPIGLLPGRDQLKNLVVRLAHTPQNRFPGSGS
jgi:hypothetical protein